MFENSSNINIDSKTSFISTENSSKNNQESELENKFNSRQEQFNLDENLSQIKEKAISKELSLGNNNRNKLIMKKRLNAKTNLENNLSLDNSKDIY